MGKEAKIGLAVILILLISLGVVVVRRLTGSREEPQASVSEPTGQPSDDAKDESAGRRPRFGAHADKATVLAPKGPSSGSSRASLTDLGQLSVVSDDDEAKRGAGRSSRSAAPQSYMPPPQDTAQPHDRYGSDFSQPPLPPAWRDDRAAASDALEGGPSQDPFRRDAGHRPTGESERGGPSPEGSRRGESAGSQVPGSRGATVLSERSAPERYGARGAEGQQMPRYGQTARYGSAPPPQPSEPARPYGFEQRSSAGMPYGAGSSGLPDGDARGGLHRLAGRTGARLGGANAGSSWSGKEARREDGTYEIQPNDNYWIISEKLYGTGAYFKALAHHNRKKVPQEDQLPAGETIAAPDVAQLEKAYPDLCPKPSHREAEKRRATTVGTPSQYGTGRVYVVQEGDTLFDIARNELGKASRWAEIYELNRDQLGPDYNYLPHGLQLVMPGSDSATGLPRRASAGSFYTR